LRGEKSEYWKTREGGRGGWGSGWGMCDEDTIYDGSILDGQLRQRASTAQEGIDEMIRLGENGSRLFAYV